MGALQAKENIWYVGVQDHGLRVFDIIMHSDHGTSYNSYIVKGTEKTVLFETSKEPFFEEFLANIREVCDPASRNGADVFERNRQWPVSVPRRHGEGRD